jgi:FAD/FMN-containing dehydrogenase
MGMGVSWIRDPGILEAYAEDASGLVGRPEALVRPASEAEVAEVVAECRASGIPLTPVGLRSSTTGSSVAFGGAVLSLERMDRILEIDTKRRRARVQPGIQLAAFKKEVAAAGLFYPPDPTSEPDCCLGGTVATNASGARTYRYGPTRRWIRALRVVLGTGETVELRRVAATKNTTGYFSFQNPVDLFVGSEGTLGIVTEVTVDLLPAPEAFYGAMAFFPSLEACLRFVLHAHAARDLEPRCLELFDGACLDLVRPDAGGLTIPREAAAALFFEVEVAPGSDAMTRSLETWLRHLEDAGALAQDTLLAETPERQEELRRLRHRIPERLNEIARGFRAAGGRKVSTDWAVPLPELPGMVERASRLVEERFGGRYFRYGHVGNGHPHFNLLAEDAEALRRGEEVAHEMCRMVVAAGGTVTAEHGVGKLKRPFLRYQYPQAVLEAMRAVKRALDPDGILAPGNIFGEETLSGGG